MAEHILYIMRHGKTQWNTEHRIQGRKDSPVLPESLETARKIGVYLADKSIRQVFASPLPRAKCTADTVCRQLCLPYREDSLLLECNHGICEGMSLEQIKENMPEFFAARESDKWHVRWPGGESYADVFGRAERFIESESVLQKSSLIVAHEMINKCILGALLHWSETETMRFKQNNRSLIVVSEHGMEAVDFT